MELLNLKGIGQSSVDTLKRINIRSVNGLLTYFPIRYEDRSKLHSLKDFLKSPSDNTSNTTRDGTKDKLSVKVEVVEHEYIQFGPTRILKIIVYDGVMSGSLVCYNRAYLRDILLVGQQYIVTGNFQYKYGELQSSNFEYTKVGVENSLSALRIVPIYQLTEGLLQKTLRTAIKDALEQVIIKDTIPKYLIEHRNLLSKEESFRELHFPSSYAKLEKARYRMKYYELFELECNVALKKYYLTKSKKKRFLKRDAKGTLYKKLLNTLNFELTDGQKSALAEIKRDLYSKYPMHRMLQGDVGSGKTVVSVLAMLLVVDNGKQSALMAPTEVLAKQNYLRLKEFTKDLAVETVLLIGGLKSLERRQALEKVSSGHANIVVGTHALFSQEVIYKELGLVVIDEQHKFGVLERGKLVSKGESTDILLMTATPIPRSLSLTVYGDLELSIIKDKPKRKAVVKSHFIYSKENKEKMYAFIDKEISKGMQGFVVCPLVEESEKLDVSSALSTYARLKTKEFKHRQLGLIHGGLQFREKEAAMDKFTNGEYDILVSTTVIEVGIDVSKASFMIIEDADRFGLSQLHQLRGRIGRGEDDGNCFFVVSKRRGSEVWKERLKVLLEHNDGFILAEEDLKLRGSGEFLGSKQTGVNALFFADLVEDKSLLELAREDGFTVILNDPKLEKEEHKSLNNTIYKRFIKSNYKLLAN